MATSWISADGFTDIRYEKSGPQERGIAKVTIARPEVRNAFRPQTFIEISRALEDAREDTSVGAIILTGEGRSRSAPAAISASVATRVISPRTRPRAAASGASTSPTCTSRSGGCPSFVVAMVAGYAIGGGHVLHLVCDLDDRRR